MAYDGIDYRGAGLIHPIAYQPHAPMTAACLASGLRIAYLLARRSARLLSANHYPRNLQSPATGRDLPENVQNTDYVKVSESYRTIPSGFTTLVGSVQAAFLPPIESTFSVRVGVARTYASSAWQYIGGTVLEITLAAGHGFAVGQSITFDTVTADGDVAVATAITDTQATTIKLAKVGAGSATEVGTITATDVGTATTLTISPPSDARTYIDDDQAVNGALAAVAAALASSLSPITGNAREAVQCDVTLANVTTGYVSRIYLEAKCVTVVSTAVAWRPYYGVVWGEVRG